MRFDAYGACPCGSGKKFKFCCFGIVGEMKKVISLHENDQPRAALQAVERVEAEHSSLAWPSILRASILLNENQPVEAKQTLEELLQDHPDHHFAPALLALASFVCDGYENARPAIFWALEHCADAFPDVVGGLARAIAVSMQASQKCMASRQYLTLAMRIGPEEDQEDVFLKLLQIESSDEIPYPLRSVHQLAEYSGPEESQKEADEARRLCDIGCWGPAAMLFGKLAENEPQNAGLWQNSGFCHAWDGNESAAAIALHKAARLHSDFATAVELETIAQLLDLNSTEQRAHILTSPYRVKSVSKLLTQLTAEDRLVRIELPPPDPDADAGERRPAGVFQVVDRPVKTEQQAEPLTVETVSNVLGELSIYDASDDDDDESAQAFLTAYEGQQADETRKIVEEAAGEEIELLGDEDQDNPFLESVPKELFSLHWRWCFSAKTPARLRRELEQQQWVRVIDQFLSRTKLTALGGRSPLEAADDPEQRLPLTAAVYVLDSFCQQNGHTLDLGALSNRLKLEVLQPIEVSEEMSLNLLSSMQLHRLSVAELSDIQLNYVLNRALLIHHRAFLYDVLTETLSRPSCLEKVDLDRLYKKLTDICSDRHKPHEALDWIAKGLEFAKTQEKAFERSLEWTIRELRARLEDPDDPALGPLVKHLTEYYCPKLPQLERFLRTLLDAYGMSSLWESADAVAGSDRATGSTTASGIWTPSSAQDSQGGEKKLWIPGQD